MRCQFGWRSSPGFWLLFSSALEHSHTHTTFQGSVVTQEGSEAVKHVRIVPSPVDAPAADLPSGCQKVQGTGGFAGSPFFVRYYVDDGILVEVRFFADGRRCLHAVRSLASDHYRLLGNRGTNNPPLLSPAKITNFETRLEVLGWTLDTHELSIPMTPRKGAKTQKPCGGVAGVAEGRDCSPSVPVNGFSDACVVCAETREFFCWPAVGRSRVAALSCVYIGCSRPPPPRWFGALVPR